MIRCDVLALLKLAMRECPDLLPRCPADQDLASSCSFALSLSGNAQHAPCEAILVNTVLLRPCSFRQERASAGTSGGLFTHRQHVHAHCGGKERIDVQAASQRDMPTDQRNTVAFQVSSLGSELSKTEARPSSHTHTQARTRAPSDEAHHRRRQDAHDAEALHDAPREEHGYARQAGNLNTNCHNMFETLLCCTTVLLCARSGIDLQ